MRSARALHAEYDRLIEAHRGILRRVVATYARRAEDRDDLGQEIQMQLWRALPQLDPGRRTSTWVYRIALNTAISWYRKSTRWQPAEIDLELVPANESQDEDPLAGTLRRLIEQLDPLHRALLCLHLDELSHGEIGEILGITAENVAVKLMRIRKTLRNLAANEPTGETD